MTLQFTASRWDAQRLLRFHAEPMWHAQRLLRFHADPRRHREERRDEAISWRT